jgi:hypothetical protein
MAKKHPYTRSHVKFHKDGSHTFHHVHSSGSHADKRGATAPGLDHLHDNLQDHLGSPNPGEAESEAGQHGIPAAMAPTPGGSPAPPTALPGGDQ